VGLSRSTVPVPPLRPHPPCLIVALASRPPSGLHNLQSRLFVPHPTLLLAVVGPGPPTAVRPPFLTSVALISYRFPLALGPAHLYLQVCGLWTRACILYRILPCVVCLTCFLRLHRSSLPRHPSSNAHDMSSPPRHSYPRRTPFLRIRQSVPSQSRDTLAESHGAFAHRSPVPPPPIERPLRSLVSGSPQPPSFSVSFYPATLLPLPLFLPQSQPTGSPIFSLCHGNMHVSMCAPRPKMSKPM
jgi:hypothetical protein